MAKKKKSRKIGQIGVPKSKPSVNSASTKHSARQQRPKKRVGLKPGSRQQLSESNSSTNTQLKTDPRLGSKKPINLLKYKQQSVNCSSSESITQTKLFFSPTEELEAIENNVQLETLLNKQEKSGLTAQEAEFVAKLTARYAELVELLNLNDNEDETEKEQNTDPYAALGAIKFSDYEE